MKPRVSVLIVESDNNLAEVWKRHLARHGADVVVAQTQEDAIHALQAEDFQVLVLDLVLPDGSALAVSDFANYRQPDARILFVTNTGFFSDGSIFQLCNNVCGFLPSGTAPDDLALMVDHYARSA